MTEVPILYKPVYWFVEQITSNCGANQWTGFYMIVIYAMKELKKPEFNHDLLSTVIAWIMSNWL